MNAITAKQLAPIFGDERKIEVSYDGDVTVIRLFDWIEGLGWSCQKTLKLDSELVTELHRALSSVRCHAARENGAVDSGKVIAFPMIF